MQHNNVVFTFSTDVNTKDNVKDQGIRNVSHFTISRNDKSQQCADKVIQRKIILQNMKMR